MSKETLDPDQQEHKDTSTGTAIVKQASEVAKTTGSDLLKEYLPQAIKTNAGALSVVLGLMSVAWTTYRVVKFSNFTRELAFEIDANDPEELARLIEEHAGEGWVEEGIDRGFRDLMEATDPLAKKCILVMVADFLKRREHPNTTYQQIGALLRVVDESKLRVIAAVADGLVKFTLDEAVSIVKVMGVKGAFQDDGIAPEIVDRFDLIVSNTFEPLPIQVEFNSMRSLAELLIQGRFISGHVPGTQHPDDRRVRNSFSICSVLDYHRPLWEQLRKYLAPVRPAATP